MRIEQTEFLKAGVPKVVFDIDGKILKRLIIIKNFAKLIFGRCIGLDWNNNCKLEAICIVNNKNNIIKAEKEDLKSKT